MDKNSRVYVCIVFLFFSCALLAPQTTHAQSLEQTATLNTKPAYPGPHVSTVVSLDAYALDITGANITWYIDSVLKMSAR
jgi:hypothetical protein